MKLESTSQTYGQLVSYPSRGDISSSPSRIGQNTTVSQRDTIVNISKATSTNDKAKIIIAAASSKDSTVDLSVGSADVDTAIVFGSVIKSKDDIKKSLTEAQKVDLSICLRSKESESIEFNSLKTPHLEGDFVYNFFDSDEKSIEIQEDQSKDPLLKSDINHVPKYVHLRWNSSKVTEALTSAEKTSPSIQQVKKNYFDKQRGVASNKNASFKNSYKNSLKKTDLIGNDVGAKVEVVDIHKLDAAFDSTVNKKLFSNSVAAIYNISDQRNVIDFLPVVSTKDKK